MLISALHEVLLVLIDWGAPNAPILKWHERCIRATSERINDGAHLAWM